MYAACDLQTLELATTPPSAREPDVHDRDGFILVALLGTCILPLDVVQRILIFGADELDWRN